MTTTSALRNAALAISLLACQIVYQPAPAAAQSFNQMDILRDSRIRGQEMERDNQRRQMEYEANRRHEELMDMQRRMMDQQEQQARELRNQMEDLRRRCTDSY